MVKGTGSLPAAAHQIVDGDRRRDLMTKHAVQTQDVNVGRRIVHEMGGENFFGDCFFHVRP
jgi:hypothetical protein